MGAKEGPVQLGSSTLAVGTMPEVAQGPVGTFCRKD